MIIKMTVRDNDFGNFFEHILNDESIRYNLVNKDMTFNKDTASSEELDQQVCNIIKELGIEKSFENKEYVEIIEKRVLNNLKYLINNNSNFNFDRDTKNYLINKLRVRCLKRFEDKWENGEAFYIIKNVWVNQ